MVTFVLNYNTCQRELVACRYRDLLVFKVEWFYRIFSFLHPHNSQRMTLKGMNLDQLTDVRPSIYPATSGFGTGHTTTRAPEGSFPIEEIGLYSFKCDMARLVPQAYQDLRLC